MKKREINPSLCCVTFWNIWCWKSKSKVAIGLYAAFLNAQNTQPKDLSLPGSRLCLPCFKKVNDLFCPESDMADVLWVWLVHNILVNILINRHKYLGLCSSALCRNFPSAGIMERVVKCTTGRNLCKYFLKISSSMVALAQIGNLKLC